MKKYNLTKIGKSISAYFNHIAILGLLLTFKGSIQGQSLYYAMSKMPIPFKTYPRVVKPTKTLPLPSCDPIQGFTLSSPAVGKLKVNFNPINVTGLAKEYYFEVWQNGEFVTNDMLYNGASSVTFDVSPGTYTVKAQVFCTELSTGDRFERGA